MNEEFKTPHTKIAVHDVEIEHIKEDIGEIKSTLQDYNKNSKDAYVKFQRKHEEISEGQVEIKSKLDGILTIRDDIEKLEDKVNGNEKKLYGLSALIAAGTGAAGSFFKGLFVS